MDENNTEYTEAFFKKVIIDAGLESPSSDFTKNVLAKITGQTQINIAFSYAPLISKKVWALLALLVTTLMGYLVLVPSKTLGNSYWSNALNSLSRVQWSIELPQWAIPDTLAYGIMAMAFFVTVQVFYFQRSLAKETLS